MPLVALPWSLVDEPSRGSRFCPAESLSRLSASFLYVYRYSKWSGSRLWFPLQATWCLSFHVSYRLITRYIFLESVQVIPGPDLLAEVVAGLVPHSRSGISTTANVFREVSSSTSSRASPLLRCLKIVPPERRRPPKSEAIVELEVGEEEVRDQIWIYII